MTPSQARSTYEIHDLNPALIAAIREIVRE